jgi:hypothetical protein
MRPSSAGASASPKAGIIAAKARTGPPSWATANQSASGSRVAKLQSVKSGSGSAKPTVAGGAPRPSVPWQLAQAAA